MKAICILFFLSVFIAPCVWGQTVEYQYDAAGNRSLRKKTIIMTPQSGMTKSSVSDEQNAESTEEKTEPVRAEEKHEDLLGECKVTIYPNPTKGLVKVEFQNYADIKDLQLHLYDSRGRLLQRTGKTTLPFELDLSRYPAGMYILWITAGKEKSEWKIIKE